jgi:ABC-type nickel/cobalt efflux system permease component RcnA
MSESFIGTLALGFVLGLKHALDADHVVAVSTIVGCQQSVWKSSLVGAFWGVGHTASLFVAAVAVIVLRVTISETVALSMEFCVGLMLMILGADVLRRVAIGEVAIHCHSHAHSNDSDPHEHASEHTHLHVHIPYAVSDGDSHHSVGRRPFLVGLVHGLAGSAALMLFVLSTISSPWLGLLYVLIFGAGTIAGMLVMSAVISLPFAMASQFRSGLVGRIQLAVGVGSLAIGAFYTWQVAVSDGLLTTLLR